MREVTRHVCNTSPSNVSARTANARTPLHTLTTCTSSSYDVLPQPASVPPTMGSGGSARVMVGRAPHRRPSGISSDVRRHGQGERGQEPSAEKAHTTPNMGTRPRPVDLQTSEEPRSPGDENAHGSAPAPRREEATTHDGGSSDYDGTERDGQEEENQMA